MQGVRRGLKIALPFLFDKVLPEVVDGFRRQTGKAVARIKRASRAVAFMGPERDAPVTRPARETETGVEQALAKADPPRLRLQQEEPQFRGVGRGSLHAEDGAKTAVARPRDPAAFADGVVMVEEIGEDAGHQRFECRVEPGFLRVKFAMTLDQPARIADAQAVQHHLACGNLHLPLPPAPVLEMGPMGINSESDMAANLQIGPTTLGMVRIYVEGDGIDLPLDFDPEEAEEIAEELRAAAAAARAMGKKAR